MTSSPRWPIRACAAVVCAAVAASGCSSAAKIQRRDGSTVRAVIVGNDDQYLHFEGLAPMRRVEIADVSHPGRGRWITGAIFLGVGGIAALGSGVALAMNECTSTGFGTICDSDEDVLLATLVTSLGLAAIGGLLFGTGVSDEQASIDAADWNGPPPGQVYAPPPPAYPVASAPPPVPAPAVQSPETILRSGLDQRSEAILVCSDRRTVEVVVAYSSAGRVTFSLAEPLAGSEAEACVRQALGTVTIVTDGTGGAFTHTVVAPLAEPPPPPPPQYDVAPPPNAPPQ